MSFSAVIQAELSANSTKFRSELNNASTQVSKLEQQMRAAGALPLPGERSARDAASVFAAQADSVDKVTAARYRAMDAAKAEESAIRANIRAREAEAAAASNSAAAKAAADNISYNRSLEASFAAPAAGAPRATGAGAPDDGSFVSVRRRFMQTMSGLGASDLVKGAGIGALVAGLRAAVNHAQELLREARELGKDLDPAVAATARLGDAIDRLKGAGFTAVNQVAKVIVDGVDGIVAASAALVGIGSIGGNLATLESDPEGEAMRREKARAEAAAAREAALQREHELQQALADLDAARVAALQEQMTTEEKIAFAQEQIRMTKEEIARIGISEDPVVAAAQELEVAKKSKQLAEEEAELARLRKERESEIAEERARAADLAKKREEDITAEKEKQAKIEADAAKRREDAIARVLAAEQKVAGAREAYQTALSDQSAATLSQIQSGQRGSVRDQRTAAEVVRLRDRAQQARDSGAFTLVGGERVAVADQLSSRANQLQGTIGSLNSAERNPLKNVEEQLSRANEELAQIRDSLEVIAI